MALTDLDHTVTYLCDRVKRLLSRNTSCRQEERIVIALAGVPGSGKTTISSAVLDRLRAQGNSQVMVVPMVRCSAVHITSLRGGWVRMC